MSCIRFNTPAQRAQMKAAAPRMLSNEEAARLHPAPPVTMTKLHRLRVLATDPNPKIREAVAASSYAPPELLVMLSRDVDSGVRSVVARNTAAPCDVLRELAGDRDETVRGWVVTNFSVPADAMDSLSHDPSTTVRSLVEWKSRLAHEDDLATRVAAFEIASLTPRR